MRGGDETMFQSYAPTSDQAVAELATGEVIEAIRHQAGFLPEVQLAYEPDLRLLWVTIKPELKPVFTLQLLDSLGKVQQAVMDLWGAPEQYHNAPVRFLAFRGTGPFFTLGGDLDFYLDCLAKNDRPALAEYARLSVEDALRNASGLNGLAVTLSTIHAKAIGGGIDAPRSCNVMIAEEQASFVYPEIKFNHFPITAVGLLSRRMGPRAAERMLQSGEEMSAAEFMAAGGLEAVVPTGTGEDWIANTPPTRCRSTRPGRPCSRPSTGAPETCAKSSNISASSGPTACCACIRARSPSCSASPRRRTACCPASTSAARKKPWFAPAWPDPAAVPAGQGPGDGATPPRNSHETFTFSS